MYEGAKNLTNGTDSIAELFKKYGDEIFRTCFLILKNRESAEDAVMDTYIRAMENMGSFRGDSAAKTWLTRIAINICKDALKSGAHKYAYDGEFPETLAAKDELSGLDLKHAVSDAVRALPDNYREAAVLHYYNGFTIKECAKIAGIPQTAMAYRIKKAGELLREALGDWYFDN